MPARVTAYGPAMLAAPDEQMHQIQTSFFLRGLAMTGAALLITQLGVAPPRPLRS